jgi:hypothetical protein
MGFFSFLTNETKRSISNVYSAKPTFPVYMLDDKGNVWKESKYEGYGDFGGKDFYELLAEMNGLKTREEGIDLAYSSKPCKYPNLVQNPNSNWIDEKTEDCPYQGFFYN